MSTCRECLFYMFRASGHHRCYVVPGAVEELPTGDQPACARFVDNNDAEAVNAWRKRRWREKAAKK